MRNKIKRVTLSFIALLPIIVSRLFYEPDFITVAIVTVSMVWALFIVVGVGIWIGAFND